MEFHCLNSLGVLVLVEWFLELWLFRIFRRGSNSIHIFSQHSHNNILVLPSFVTIALIGGNAIQSLHFVGHFLKNSIFTFGAIRFTDAPLFTFGVLIDKSEQVS